MADMYLDEISPRTIRQLSSLGSSASNIARTLKSSVQTLLGLTFGEVHFESMVRDLCWDSLYRQPERLIRARAAVRQVARGNRSKTTAVSVSSGFLGAVLQVLKEEATRGRIAASVRDDRDGETVTAARLIADLLPPVRWRDDNFGRLSRVERGMLLGREEEEEEDKGKKPKKKKKIEREACEHARNRTLQNLASAYDSVFEICRSAGSLHVHRVLLIKMICLALGSDCPRTRSIVRSEGVEGFLTDLLRSPSYRKARLGLMASDLLLKTSPSSCFKENEEVFLALRSARELLAKTQWMQTYDILESFQEIEELGAKEIRSRRRPSRTASVRHLLNFILAGEVRSLPVPDSVARLRYARLRTFVGVLLDQPEEGGRCPVAVDPARVRAFSSLVRCLVRETELVQMQRDLDGLSPSAMDDMFEEERFCNAPRTPKDVELGLERLPALDRVLGPSRSHGDFSDEPLAAALRLLSILSVANETWGELLFSSLTDRPLIAREEFLSYFLQDSYVDWLQTEIHFGPTSHPPEEEEESHEAMLAEYRFLMSLELRNAMFARRLARLQNSGFDSWERTISVSREGLFDGAVDALRGLRPRGRWEFRFRGEMGIGSGPTKEFYTEFSREARRHDLDLWAGDPAVEGSDGRLYAHPPCGLFPRPVATSQPGTDDASVVLGKVFAMSVLDDQLMDLNFSPAFYKALLVVDPEVQVLTLADLKHVAPSVYDFVPDLVVALRERSTIERNPTLTAEESRRAASEIKCNGASFDDLCIDFTLPGYPDVEMKPGGRDELLSVDNAEEYLKLLTWWLLYKGPQSRLKQMREGFVSVLPVSYLNLHRPDEFENFLPGPEVQRWTVSDLTLSCSLDDGLTAKTPVVRHLFDVLSSLAGEEQKQFIQFVTGQRRLPTGRLSDLQPRLTVKFVQSDEPDERLPSSSTCFNTLFLTAYSTREILREKLMLAVREGAQSFQFY